MESYALFSSVVTTMSFVLFIGIVAWAWSGRRREAFARAANEPFALPDDLARDESGEMSAQGRPERESAPKRAARRADR